MSEKFAVEVSDELAAKLHDDENVDDTLVAALRQVYGVGEEDDNAAAKKQAELQRRMGLDPANDGDDEPAVAEEELADMQREQLRKFMLGERKDGLDKSKNV